MGFILYIIYVSIFGTFVALIYMELDQFEFFFFLIHIHIIISFRCGCTWLIDLDSCMRQSYRCIIPARVNAHLPAGRGRSWRLLLRLLLLVVQTGVVVAVVGRGGGSGGCCTTTTTTDIEQPGMAENILQVDPVLWPHPQARLDQIPAGVWQTTTKVQPRQDNLFILLEGYVSLDHVEQKDTQGPDCSRSTQVALAGYPLGRGVYTGSWKIKKK